MTESRDFGRMAQELRQALDQYSREELADLLCHIMRTYVIEAGASIEMDTGPEPGLADLRQLSFAQLILRLQMSLPHEELRRLEVSGSRVWVSDNGREVALTHEEGPASMPAEDFLDPSPVPSPVPATAPVPIAPTPEPQESFDTSPAPPARTAPAPAAPAPAAPAAPAPRRAPEPDPWEASGGAWDPPARDPEPTPEPPRVERVEANPEPWRPAPAVTRQASAGTVAPSSGEGFSGRRPGITMEDMGQVSRPSAGLRGQTDTAPRFPGEENRQRRRPSWAAEPTVDEVPPPEPVEDDITEVSERFSMLELD